MRIVDLLLYLPPSEAPPDLNPIEEAFFKDKGLLRKVEVRSHEALVEAMGSTLSAVTAYKFQFQILLWLEAMACSVPVDGSREAVRDGALGILVDPSDQGDIRVGILEALRRPKGVIPQGLDYFSYINFERRLHRILENVVSMR